MAPVQWFHILKVICGETGGCVHDRLLSEHFCQQLEESKENLWKNTRAAQENSGKHRKGASFLASRCFLWY